MPNLNTLRFRQAEATAAADSTAAAARSAFRAIDDVVRAAPDRTRWACARGCNDCCHLLVRVTAHELRAIHAHLRATWSDGARRELHVKVAAAAAHARGCPPGAYRRRRIRCAFLDDAGDCAIYEHRPIVCRVHASRSKDACASTTDVVPLDTWLSKAGQAVHAGLSDAPPVELHETLRAMDGEPAPD